MSTRCQVKVKGSWDEVWFYRHSDGYPEGVKGSFEKFLSWVKEGKIRDNAEQSSGWLVVIGADEYKYHQIPGLARFSGNSIPDEYENKIPNKPNNDWKVGAYEPCAPKEHGDIAYLYTIDLESKQAYYFENGKKIIVC